jgi:hypothetical protein
MVKAYLRGAWHMIHVVKTKSDKDGVYIAYYCELDNSGNFEWIDASEISAWW